MKFAKGVLCVAVLLVCVAAASGQETLNLAVGQERTIEAAGIVKVAVGNPTVAKVRDVGDGKLLVTAIGPGHTEVLMWDEAGNEKMVSLNVAVADPKKILEGIEPLVADVEGVKAFVAGDKVILDGQVLTEADLERVTMIASSFPGVLNLVKLNLETAEKIMQEKLQQKVDSLGVEVAVVEGTCVLSGTVNDEATKEQAAKLVEPFAETVVNSIEVDDRMVEIDVHFLQVDSRKATDYGVNLPQRIQFGFNLGFDSEHSHERGSDEEWAIARAWEGFQEGPTDRSYEWAKRFSKASMDSLTYGYSVNLPTANYLNWVLSKNIGKIVAQPHLTAHNGQEASFHAGGTSYFAIQGGGGAAGVLESVDWGTLLEIEPTFVGPDLLQCKIKVEVSAPTDPNQGESYRVIVYESEGVVKCALGETVVVAGLLQEVVARFKNETPLLGKIPLVNLFFSESSKSKNNEDLLILVTPYAPTVERSGEPSKGSDYQNRKQSIQDAR